MQRRNFLKKLGIGIVSTPIAIKSLGDQKAKEFHEHIPDKVKVYKGKPENNIDYSITSQDSNICSGTVGSGDFYPYESFKNLEVLNGNRKI